MFGPEIADESATDGSDHLRNLRKKLQDAGATRRPVDRADLKWLRQELLTLANEIKPGMLMVPYHIELIVTALATTIAWMQSENPSNNKVV